MEDNNLEELEMLYLALKDTEHGLFLFKAESREQDKIVNEIIKHFDKSLITVKDARLINWDNKNLDISFFKNWKNNEPGCKIYLLYNLQSVPKSKNEQSFCEAFNFVRDGLIALNANFVFGVSPYFVVELSQYAPDLYSFFGYQANFKFRLKQDNIEIKELRIYPGDIIIARERLIEIYNEIRVKGIENYQPNIISLKYLCNFLENWNKVYEYLSFDYSIDILAITTKVESIIRTIFSVAKDAKIRYNRGNESR